jgi:hypothetical protein
MKFSPFVSFLFLNRLAVRKKARCHQQIVRAAIFNNIVILFVEQSGGRLSQKRFCR